MRRTFRVAVWMAAAVAPSSALAQPLWAAQPTGEDFAHAGQNSPDGMPSGVVRVLCKVADDGVLSGCAVESEDPAGVGLGPIALALAAKFRATPEAARRMKGAVVLPIRFGPVEATPPRRDARFKRDGYPRLGDAGPYYPDRAAQMRVTAVVEADCRVAADSRLQGCRIVSLSPPDYGFEFAFLKMAQHGWMTAAPPPEGVAAPQNGVWRFRMIFDGKRR